MMIERKKIDYQKFDEAILAILLFSKDDCGQTLKVIDEDTLIRLHSHDLIENPSDDENILRFRPKGQIEAERLFAQLFYKK